MVSIKLGSQCSSTVVTIWVGALRPQRPSSGSKKEKKKKKHKKRNKKGNTDKKENVSKKIGKKAKKKNKGGKKSKNRWCRNDKKKTHLRMYTLARRIPGSRPRMCGFLGGSVLFLDVIIPRAAALFPRRGPSFSRIGTTPYRKRETHLRGDCEGTISDEER